MARVDTPYVIGVIREKEKTFLEEDEFTRIIEAPSAQDSVRALTDTVYGIHLDQVPTPYDALTAHLREEMEWLRDVVDDEKVLQFIAARYDALNSTRAILDLAADNESLSEEFSELGYIPRDALFYALWHDERWDAIPSAWREFVRSEKEQLGDESWRKDALLVRIKAQFVSVLEELAHTPLMRQLALHTRTRLDMDARLRARVVDSNEEDAHDADVPAFLSDDVLDEIGNETSATGYELAWDGALIELLKPFRDDPTGYDAILAYWFAKEMEAKTLRLLLSARLGGLAREHMTALKRPLYRAQS